jgi:hypothetical protein
MATTQREKIEDGIVTFKPNGDVQDPTMQFIGEILSKAYHKFTANELKADPQKLFPKLFSFIDQNLSELNLGRETIFKLTKELTIKIGRDNANVQASIYQANNDMGRTM